ncbi:putative rhomboid family serine protease [Aureococcus anophagefferens virus]|uniref:Putative rhomboid family serine protease n=1 Tax=Aureococcus anophagefferens virus TaxID=1474867 RepID=A0A076FGD9_9VIRU|nr:putative rhomboid family serine protease [Aureococcus anophagefferens virus]AII17145.1 putative rhomboid family serine protease [Aureococcus anophagefferens virus]UOG94377.1 serine-type endopeptidase [Aureococcus anophagefferens virus]
MFQKKSSVKISDVSKVKLFYKNDEVDDYNRFLKHKEITGDVDQYDSENDTYKIINIRLQNKFDILDFNKTQEDFHVISKGDSIEPNETVRYKIPYFMMLISLLQSGVFTFFIVSRNKENKLMEYAACPNELYYSMFTENCRDNRENVYMMLSYQLCHRGIAHLISNVFLQLIMGIPIELMFGSVKMLILYNAGVLGGSMFCFLFNPYTRVLGASAGVYSLFGIHLAHLIINWEDIKYSFVKRWERILGLCSFLGIEIATSILSDSRTSHVAHLGGSVAGVLGGIILLDNFKVLYWEKIFILITKCVTAFLFGAFSFYYSFKSLNYNRC